MTVAIGASAPVEASVSVMQDGVGWTAQKELARTIAMAGATVLMESASVRQHSEEQIVLCANAHMRDRPQQRCVPGMGFATMVLASATHSTRVGTVPEQSAQACAVDMVHAI